MEHIDRNQQQPEVSSSHSVQKGSLAGRKVTTIRKEGVAMVITGLALVAFGILNALAVAGAIAFAVTPVGWGVVAVVSLIFLYCVCQNFNIPQALKEKYVALIVDRAVDDLAKWGREDQTLQGPISHYRDNPAFAKFYQEYTQRVPVKGVTYSELAQHIKSAHQTWEDSFRVKSAHQTAKDSLLVKSAHQTSKDSLLGMKIIQQLQKWIDYRTDAELVESVAAYQFNSQFQSWYENKLQRTGWPSDVKAMAESLKQGYAEWARGAVAVEQGEPIVTEASAAIKKLGALRLQDPVLNDSVIEYQDNSVFSRLYDAKFKEDKVDAWSDPLLDRTT